MIAPVTLIQLNACGGALDMAPEKFGFLRDSSEAAIVILSPLSKRLSGSQLVWSK